MAAPQLKRTVVAAPARRLINSGVVPTTQVRLKGMNGQVIKPKAPLTRAAKKGDAAKEPEEPAEVTPPVAEATPTPQPTPTEPLAPVEEEAPAPEAAAPVEEEAPAPEAAAPVEEEAPAPEAAAPVEEEAPAPAEEPAEPAAEPPAEAEAAVDADEAAQAQYEKEMEEYNRQMEEYNRQMEAYNRQLEEQAAAQAAEAAAEPLPEEAAPEATEQEVMDAPPVPEIHTPAAEITKAAIAAKKAQEPHEPVPAPPAPLPASLKNNAPKTDEAAEGTEIDAAMVAMLQSAADKKPIYKSPLFLVACIALLIVAAICGYLIIEANAEHERMIAQNARIKKILVRAQNINKEGIETLAEAKEKNVDVSCSLEEAQFLMNVVVNPSMKDEKGKPMFGNNPDGTAQLACLLISIACEADNTISKAIFERLDKEAPQIKPALYRWLVQRLAVAEIKGINPKLRKLADAVSKQNDPKFRKRNELLSYIWEAMGLRVSEKDIPTVIKLLKDPELDNMLGNTLINYLSNIIRLTDNEAKKAEIGDNIFDALPERLRTGASDVLARSGSAKALEYFKERAADPKNWRTDRNFFANYASDDILPFLEELRMKTAGDKKNETNVQAMITGLFLQNRDRTLDQARRLLQLIPTYDKLDMDTSDWEMVNAKTDPYADAFVGEDSPEYPQLKKRRDEIEASRKQKLTLISQLSNMFDYAWVRSYLDKFSREPDELLAREARQALEKTQYNRESEERLQQKHKARTKS